MNELSALSELLLMLLTEPRTAVLFALLFTAAVIDLRTRKIPNWLSFTGAAFGLAYAVVVPFSAQSGFLNALGGLGLGLLLPLPLYAFGVMGAGDVKLFAMAGAFLGMPDIVYALVCSFIVGGGAAVAFALFHGVLGRVMANIAGTAQQALLSIAGGMRPHAALGGASIGRMPYGVSISVGTIGFVVARQLGYL